jgi:hypothetical protein
MKVKSSNLSDVEWREVNGQGEMDVTFHTGDIYRFYSVPRGIYEKLVTAPSIGRFFATYVKNVGYRFEKIGHAGEGSLVGDLVESFMKLPAGLQQNKTGITQVVTKILEKHGIHDQPKTILKEQDESGEPRIRILEADQ